MRAKIIFLDIDGVLNVANASENEAPAPAQRLNRIVQATRAKLIASLANAALIVPECAQRLNRIIKQTGAKLVISSAWRNVVHSRQMTEFGFQYLLWSHGIQCQVYGVTPKDEQIQARGKQIAAWLAENGPVETYVVIDDDNYDFRECGHPFVKTNGGTGLSDEDTALAIELLNREEASA